ncbi:MAG: DUF7010 family protein [Chloroflexota bacterium]
MILSDAQREVRSVFLGGAVGQLVTGLIWLLSAALSTLVGQREGILALVFGGMFIFPLTQLALRLTGRAASLRRENPLGQLILLSTVAMGATYPLIYAATAYNLNWFYPAFMIVVGAHYLSFVFAYGMWQYGGLAVALIGGGLVLALYFSTTFSAGGWLAGLTLLVFAALVARAAVWR